MEICLVGFKPATSMPSEIRGMQPKRLRRGLVAPEGGIPPVAGAGAAADVAGGHAAPEANG